MSTLSTSRLKENSLIYLESLRDSIDFEPAYQRQGDIWTLAKKQLLIDSIINDYDVPKLYLHQFEAPQETDGRRYRYALIDGKQRLETIYSFLDSNFALSKDFSYFRDPALELRGKSYFEIKAEFPVIAAYFQQKTLDVVVVRTDDSELIEDMFSRLNEAVPLNAAEKRNAIMGPAQTAVRKLVGHEMFAAKLPFQNSRYRHDDLAAKFISIEQQIRDPEILRVADTKKLRLDKMFKTLKEDPNGVANSDTLSSYVVEVLDSLDSVFSEKDKLLFSVGTVVVYYMLFRRRLEAGRSLPRRQHLEAFETARRNTVIDEEDVGFRAGFLAYRTYNGLVQSANDGRALTRRVDILDAYITALERGTDEVESIAQFAE